MISHSRSLGEVFRILGISGSGRRESYNTALLRAACLRLPEGATLEIFDVSRLPLFNVDLETSLPQAVMEFKAKVREADAILFASPEYNYSVSAVLKNAIEWGNRPENSWDGKPAAIMSASSSPRGGARVQLHLRQIMVDLNMYPINEPQLLVARAEEKFDGLILKDERSLDLLTGLLATLVRWGEVLKRGCPSGNE